MLLGCCCKRLLRGALHTAVVLGDSAGTGKLVVMLQKGRFGGVAGQEGGEGRE